MTNDDIEEAMKPRHATGLFPFALFLLAGCAAQPAASGPAQPMTPPAWSTNDEWRYTDGKGAWENWTVVGQEVVNGVQTYRVAIQYFPVHDFGVGSATAWIDTRSLGYVKQAESDGFQASWAPAIHQLFPFQDRVYNVTMSLAGLERPMRILYTAGDWEVVQTPAGRFEARRVEMIDTHTEQAHYVMWYEPQVGNFIKRQDDDATYELKSWNRAGQKRT